MDFYLGLVQIIGVHTLLGLSAYCVLLTGQVSLAQAGFFAVGAYVAGMLTVLAGWAILPALAASSLLGAAVACAVGLDELAAQSVGLNLTAVKVSAMTVGGAIAGLGGGIYAHYTTHIEHGSFNILMATFAIAYPIVGGLRNVFGTLAAVLFVQAFLVEGLRELGDWRNLLFGALIVLAMNLRPHGLFGRRGA